MKECGVGYLEADNFNWWLEVLFPKQMIQKL
jgi:hypothetical protein